MNQLTLQWFLKHISTWHWQNDRLQSIGPALNTQVRRLKIDSRQVQPGDIFVALPGASVDGHDFIAQAANAGALVIVSSAAWWQQQTATQSSENCHTHCPTLVVNDSQLFLKEAARAYRSFYQHVGFAAVTGSCGKTTVKGIAGQLLADHCKALVPIGSQNNHLGVPMTLSRLVDGYDLGIAELGANHQGEIATMVELVQPVVVGITGVSAAHIGEFGSIDIIAKAKGEIFSQLRSGHFAILNRDDHFYEHWRASLLPGVNCLTIGGHDNADLRLVDDQIVLNPACVKIGCPNDLLGQSLPLQVSLAGAHNKFNAIFSFALVCALGTVHKCAWVESLFYSLQNGSAFAALRPETGRLVVHELAGKRRVIDDSYNAAPQAVAGALKVLEDCQGSKWFVMADMQELGEYSDQFHREVGEQAAAAKIDQFWAIGPGASLAAKTYAQLYPGAIACFCSRDTLQAALLKAIEQQAPNTILIKGARSAKLEVLVKQLLA